MKAELRDAICELLKKRSPGKTICPSEAARKAFPEDWRDYMELTREVARDMSEEELIEICQGGEVVDPAEAKGPIRLRLRSC
ncbi:MAG: DUF3253 domain-containing protein [Verrucomicrobiota bacterium]